MVFYAIVVCILLAVLGLDPLAIFVSLSTIVLAFSFMISRASSNYFEGMWLLKGLDTFAHLCDGGSRHCFLVHLLTMQGCSLFSVDDHMTLE